MLLAMPLVSCHQLIPPIGETLKREKLVLDWQKQQKTKSAVRLNIETMLDNLLPNVYAAALFEQKSNLTFQHILDLQVFVIGLM